MCTLAIAATVAVGPSCSRGHDSAPPRATARAHAPAPAAAAAPAPASETRVRVPTGFPLPGSFDDALQRLDTRILGLRQSVRDKPNNGVVMDRIAGLYLQRARLSGDYQDYKHAEEWVDRAFARGTEGVGPFTTRARMNYSLHRLPQVDADLPKIRGRVLQKDNYRGEHIGLTADVAFQRGQYSEALKGYEEALAVHRSATNIARLAHYRWKTGDYAAADALYDEAMGMMGDAGSNVAWFRLMRGVLVVDGGRAKEAFVAYQLAAQALPGYWLVEEHIAEILTLLGQTDAALALYREIVARTGNPEFMDAIAGILQERGDEAGARAMIARARARYDELIGLYPEAAYGHALDHFLEFSDDIARTLELAEANHGLRPNAEAKGALAEAYLKASRPQDAVRVIEEALATPFRSADVYATASAAYAATGDAARSEDMRVKALAINPRVFD